MSASPSTPIGARQGRKGRKIGTPTTQNAEKEIPLSPLTAALEVTSIAEPPSSTKSTRKPLRPRNVQFEKDVLGGHGIKIDRSRRPTLGPFSYFDTGKEDYTKIASLDHINVWINESEDGLQAIADEYSEMMRQKLCEDEYATFAKENLLKGQRRSHYIAEDGRFRIQRLVNPYLMPNPSNHWVKPPMTKEDGVDWNWDIRPDCAYWLSLRGFNEDWRSQVENVTYVNKIVACPYFTVEFKRDNESADVAIKQVAAAGSIALYNRFSLYQKALQRNTPNLGFFWASPPIAEVRHFGLTFVGAAFELWVLKPAITDEGDWAGCTMERLCSGDCEASFHNTKVLTEWINEIHRWGLTVHGPACKDEIKVCLRQNGLMTSLPASQWRKNLFDTEQWGQDEE